MLYQLSHVRMLLRACPCRASLSGALKTLAHLFRRCQIESDPGSRERKPRFQPLSYPAPPRRRVATPPATALAAITDVVAAPPSRLRRARREAASESSSRIGESCATFSDRWGDWRSGSALRSHRRGRRFEPAIAHHPSTEGADPIGSAPSGGFRRCPTKIRRWKTQVPRSLTPRQRSHGGHALESLAGYASKNARRERGTQWLPPRSFSRPRSPTT